MFAEQEGEVRDDFLFKKTGAETNDLMADLPAYFEVNKFHA